MTSLGGKRSSISAMQQDNLMFRKKLLQRIFANRFICTTSHY